MMGVVIALLVLLSAFFSATETAFSFVNKIRVQHAVENGDKKAEKVLWVIEHFDNALTAILICNNIVNLGCSSIATVLCLRIFGDIGSAIEGALRRVHKRDRGTAQGDHHPAHAACIRVHEAALPCAQDLGQE